MQDKAEYVIICSLAEWMLWTSTALFTQNINNVSQDKTNIDNYIVLYLTTIRSFCLTTETSGQ